jgi:cell division septation protein DedD
MSSSFSAIGSSGGALRVAILAMGMFALSGCDESGDFNLTNPFAAGAEAEATATPAASGEVIERDVEAPEVFSSVEQGLWDGRPSLGGVWVAHPDVTEPERVLITNNSNGQTVVGALFRRERDIPGPRLQMSSDAATAIGVLAGAPVELSVVALRKETIEVAPAPGELDTAIAEAPVVAETPLDPIAAAGAAIEAPVETTTTAAVAPAAPPPAPVQTSSLEKPYIQIGIFSVEANANQTANQMRSAGLIPTVLSQESAGKPFWRVIVGPAATASERKQLLETVQSVGFSDAYAVTN